jgi:sulfotransferase
MYNFISGMPRSGSTLLCNVLAQNPDIEATATSGILDVLFSIRNGWNEHIEFKAMDSLQRDVKLLNVLRSVLCGYFEDVNKPYIFDKSRGWLAYIEMAEAILQRPIKILVPVRDIRDILASFEKLWRDNAATSQMKLEQEKYFDYQSVEGRCRALVEGSAPVGLAYNRIKDAIHRGYRHYMHFVRYEQLTSNPEKTMHKVYDFLEIPYFEHDFQNVVQVTVEDDSVHGYKDLHTIRPVVTPQAPKWPLFLGDVAKAYENQEVW